MVLVDNAKSGKMYDVSLATGPCGSPSDVLVIARFIGTDGDKVHVDTPIIPLTSGKYVLILRPAGNPGAGYGCGQIKHDWF